MSGLVQSVRKNVERRTEVLPDSDYQYLQHFVTHSLSNFKIMLGDNLISPMR